MSRRIFLQHSTNLAASLAWFSLFGQHQMAQASPKPWFSKLPLFTLGVASGDPRPNSVVLWTRLAPHPFEQHGGMPPHAITVKWEVAHDEYFSRIAQQGQMVTDAMRAHSVHVEVNGLDNDRRYFYRFIAGGQSSPVGRTRTAPSLHSPTQRLRIALASCQHFEMGEFTVHQEIAQQELDFVLFVGDYLYLYNVPSSLKVRRHATKLSDAPSLNEFRVHHASYKLDANLRAAHAAHPWILMWDDQEVRNDYDGLVDPEQELNPEAFLQLRQRAYQAYYEHLPISPSRAPTSLGAPMYTQYSWGQLARLKLLDTRQYRSGPPCHNFLNGPRHGKILWRCDRINHAQQTMLGQKQEQWLAKNLANTSPTWQILAQTTQISAAPLPTPWEPILYGDGWDAYPNARQSLLQAMAQEGVKNVVCLGGDVHRHVAANLRQRAGDASSKIVGSEFVSSSITSKGLGRWLNDKIAAANPDVLHCRSDERGYALLDISTKQLTCTFRGTPHPVQAHAALKTQAQFMVLPNKPGIQKI